ncbi:MAG: hypothetical protein L6R38_005129 [Xanthoria sp. 2 TBL-2021]|nr:MAG: hypothetical protein L6R38_005129 [Xanthoria sp. 2 TBL-2021]
MSASPAASPNDAQVSGQPAKSGNEQVKFRFCGDCSNMLAPKEDRINNKLMYCCRMCQYSEEADSACIFRNNIYNVIGETAGVTQDVGSDPTLPRSNKRCPKCHEVEAVFFQSQQRSAETGMKLFYVCCSCGHIFQ